MKEFSCPVEASNWLKEGKILIHPTEGVWGLGCDALNINACKKISLLKQRPGNKNFILLAPSISFALDHSVGIKASQIEFLESVWPGHVTVILQANNLISSAIKAIDNTIAIRVSNHLPINTLFEGFNSLLVSTSANISGQDNINDPEEIMSTFDDADVAYYNEALGLHKRPSRIIDLSSREIIRN